MSRLEDNRNEEIDQENLMAVDPRTANKQRRQMLMAMGILSLALVLVLVKDWQFWFPPDVASDSVPGTGASSSSASAKPKTEIPQAATPTTSRSKQKGPTQPAASTESLPELAGPSITASQRKVLPPLEVEVIAGGPRRTLQPKNNTIKVDLQDEAGQPAASASETTLEPTSRPTADASASVRMSPETAQMVTRPVEPSYPLLAKQMKVQGAVVLQALIGREGNIEDLRVLSGPAILSSAAMEAVKQWHFKPYFQGGRAVDTEARITVNFTISTY
jgi:TonB family protein